MIAALCASSGVGLFALYRRSTASERQAGFSAEAPLLLQAVAVRGELSNVDDTDAAGTEIFASL